MTLGRSSEEGWTLAPVPHGAAFPLDCPGAVTAPPGIPVETAAVARFQQIALLGLTRLPAGVEVDDAVVIGSGPIALGAVLELLRRGATRVRVATSRPDSAPVSLFGVVRIPLAKAVADGASLVIDAVGAPERAAGVLVPGAVLGLLGTPPQPARVAARAAHRDGWTVIGMHELAPTGPGAYQDAYTTACSWLTDHLGVGLTASLCRTVPGHIARLVYQLLGTSTQVVEPVIIFDWQDG